MNDNEINAIIARAMQEYSGTHQATAESTPTPVNTVPDAIVSQDAVVPPEVPYVAAVDTGTYVASNSDSSEANEVIDHIINTAEDSAEDEEEEVTDTLPENPGSLEVDDSDSRFRGAEWFEDFKKLDITIAGVGGIGSYVAFLVSRLRPNSISLYDDDIIEESNLSGQLYERSDIGCSKVSALGGLIYNFSNYSSVFEYQERFREHSTMHPILICGFDNMEARKIAFNRWEKLLKRTVREDRKNYLFIDGRLAAEEFQVFCITGDNQWAIDEYKKNYLFSDSEADEVVCSYKQTSYAANMIGTIITNLLVNFTYNKGNRPIVRSLPFLTEYSATTMLLKETN